MRVGLRILVLAASAILLLSGVTIMRAETWPLGLKRLDSSDRSRGFSSPIDYLYRATSPQYFSFEILPDPKGGLRLMGAEQYEPDFKKIVKKEPAYQSKRPLKGVAKLGTQQFAFVLDVAKPPEPEKPDAKEKSDPAKAEAKTDSKATTDDKAKTKGKSPIAESKEKQAQKKPAIDVPLYDRLYFDVNHNGDLTDDKAMEGRIQKYPQTSGQSYAQLSFPRLDVSIDADGTPMESAIFFSGYMNSSPDWGLVGIQINAGAYREGEITLEGKKRKVVLIDFNSNGRFDDETKVITIQRYPGDKGQFYPQSGDMLLIDPKESRFGYDDPYDVTSSDYRYNVSKLVRIDGRYYDLKITPSGDKLTLDASKTRLGNITNPNDGFRALIQGKAGVLKISGNKDEPTPVPTGEWSLLSYTITLPEKPKAPEPVKKEAPKPEKTSGKDASAMELLSDALKSFLEKPSGESSRPRWSLVSARATAENKAVKVEEGKTVVLPFGPPYKPLVTAPDYGGDPENKELEMALVGSAGEICTNLMTHGDSPPKPSFTITDPKGKVVEQGSFEYG
jgi:hypothetical protein